MIKKYKIYAGSLNSAQYIETVEMTSDNAAKYAWELACEDFESYEGLHGTRDIAMIMEEDNITDENDAWEVYEQERESWLDYYIKEV